MITVMKFGGTSVGSPEALKRVAGIIANTEGQKVVVASAMSGITNFLVDTADMCEKDRETAINEFGERHMDTAKKLFDDKQMAAFVKEFNERFSEFTKVVLNRNKTNDPYHLDNISSQGERFSTLLLAHVLKSIGQDAVAMTSEDCGICAEGKPLNGSAVLDKTETMMSLKVKPVLDQGKIPVITGFYGITNDKKPLTFGRGGSDYSAAVVASGLNADNLEIWTDVDGFMSADPRVIKDAILIKEMNYGEAAELAYFGAKVLHPRTIEPVRLKHIPLSVRNSFKPEDAGTISHHLRTQTAGILKSVAVKTDLSIVSISSAEIAYRPRMVARILEKISENDVIIYSISTSLSTVAFLIHNNDVNMAMSRLQTLDPGDIERIEVKNDVALICAVGDDLLAKCGVSGEIFSAVKEAKANVEMISEGASDVSLNFVVPMSMATDVMKILHSKYVSGNI